MPKFLVAYAEDGERVARTSMAHIKTALAEHPNTEWEVATYKEKFDLATICQIINDLSELAAEEVVSIRVNEKGQCRKVKS